VGEMRSIQNFV